MTTPTAIPAVRPAPGLGRLLFEVLRRSDDWVTLGQLMSQTYDVLTNEECAARYKKYVGYGSAKADAPADVRAARGRELVVMDKLRYYVDSGAAECDMGRGLSRRYRRAGAPLPTLTVGGQTFTLLFPDLLRPLNGRESDALRESIRAVGVISPLIVDDQGGIIDGINRATIAAELGLSRVPVQVVTGKTFAEKIDLAYALNDARRHLTPAQVRQLALARRAVSARRRREGATLEQIAEETGVSVSQARKDVAESALHQCKADPPSAPAPPPARVTGKDGKLYPAKYRPRQPKAAPAAVVASLPAHPQPPSSGTPLHHLRHWWGLATANERAEFLAEVDPQR